MQNYTFLTKPYLYLLLFIFIGSGLKAQDSIDISVLTCGTGTAEVYQAYGHTGIRVKNHTKDTDIVYNYGMFSFDEDGFLIKFIQGKLLYFVATEDFDSFMYDYEYFGRSVREQLLNLSPIQKTELIAALEKNALTENRYYLYDFIYNNCSTQPRDLIRNTIGTDFKFKTLATENTETIRELVDKHMKYNEWLDFGIDLLLGVRFDKVADADTRMFLPAELMVEFDSTIYHGEPIIADSRILYHGTEQIIPKILDPTLLFWIILAITMLLQVFFPTSTFRKAMAFTYLIFTGIIGWILTFMWVGTDHYMTKWNYNLLWAIPIYFPLAIFFFKAEQSKFIHLLIKTCRVILVLLLILWPLNPQQFHSAIIPIILLLIWSLGVFLSIPRSKKSIIS
ncbi:MAG TPA: DUF4105 domain-containing protein [Chitinophagales bacterium]|nr:DUF4105 domain-containing protein [Chitinophagales bacterium]